LIDLFIKVIVRMRHSLIVILFSIAYTLRIEK
jgi:hypothetical protein